MKKNKIILTTLLLCGLFLSGQAQTNKGQGKALAEYMNKNNEAAIDASLLRTGTLLQDSVINSGKFNAIKHIPLKNGHHLMFIQKKAGNYSSYYAMVYNAAYQSTDLKEYRYSCKTCPSTDTISRLWLPEDRTQKDFFIEYYSNNVVHMPLYTVNGIKTEYFRINGAGKIIMIKSDKK